MEDIRLGRGMTGAVYEEEEEEDTIGSEAGERTHPAVHRESWIPAVCLPQTRGNLEHK